MIVVALLVVGCLPKGQYAQQYVGTDAARIVLYGDYAGVFILDGSAVEPVNGVLSVSPGRHELNYKRGAVMALPYTRVYEAGKVYFFDMGMSWAEEYFYELTPEEYALKVANDSARRAQKD
jgi:hypothetical protein